MRHLVSVCLAVLAASTVHAQIHRVGDEVRPRWANRELALGQQVEREIAADEEARFLFRAPDGERDVVISTYTVAGNSRLAVVDAETGVTLCANDSADAEKPCAVKFGDDSRAVEIVVTGDTFATYRLRVGTTASATILWPVPYISQQWYANYGESACGPTSTAMLLRYYYPRADVQMPHVYRSGTQLYRYDDPSVPYKGGPAVGYRNVGFQPKDSALTYVPWQYQPYYLGKSAPAVMAYITTYLDRIWGISVANVGSSRAALYNAIQNGPMIARVNGNGNALNDHILAVIGTTADSIVVHDPYTWKDGVSGNTRKVPIETFFNKWYRNGYTLTPADSVNTRQYTTVVDIAHSTLECNCTPVGNRFNVEQPNEIWNTFYGYGRSYYTPTVGGKAARWTPQLHRSGWYKVAVKFDATSASGTVGYSIHGADGTMLGSKYVSHYGSGPTYNILGTFYLSNGASVKAWSIPAGTRVSAVKFIFVQ